VSKEEHFAYSRVNCGICNICADSFYYKDTSRIQITCSTKCAKRGRLGKKFPRTTYRGNPVKIKPAPRKLRPLSKIMCEICSTTFMWKGIKRTCSKECHYTLITSFSGHSTKTKYWSKQQDKFVTLGSSWEVTMAKWLDSLNYRWIRPKSIPWKDSSGKAHNYYPDFYLIDYRVYLDPKNRYCIVKDKEKIEAVTKEITLFYGYVGYIQQKILSLEECASGAAPEPNQLSADYKTL
jgi:hypothetical protein